MMKRMRGVKLKNPAVALILLALAANVAIRSYRWNNHHSEYEQYDGELIRRLAHAGNSAYERTWRGLVSRGYEPGTPQFERIMHNHIQAKRRKQRRKAMQDRVHRERKEMVNSLRNNTEVWLRGGQNTWHREEEVKAAMAADVELQEKHNQAEQESDYQPLEICDRPVDVGSTEDFASLQKNSQCPEISKDKPIMLIEGVRSHGRTGNNLVEFLHAIQQARDNDVQLGVMDNSWAMQLLTKMWMAIEGDDWVKQFEDAFCVKVFNFIHASDVADDGWDVIHLDTKDLLHYGTKVKAPLGEYIANQEYDIRALFRNYNTGTGHDKRGLPVKDMCSGINAIFGDDRRNAIYSVIHSRTLEGEPGYRLLRNVARKSGCDPVAALKMEPEYIKSILEPLGMTKYPIAFITDGQNSEVLEKLTADPEIGPLIRVVPKEACWLGGDITLAVMSNVFIGNPASSFTAFIAKARLALGFGHNYLFRAKDENGQWKTVCGDHCVFDKTIMGVLA